MGYNHINRVCTFLLTKLCQDIPFQLLKGSVLYFAVFCCSTEWDVHCCLLLVDKGLHQFLAVRHQLVM